MAANGVAEFYKERRKAARRPFDLGRVELHPLIGKGGALIGFADGFNTEVARLGVRRLPQFHLRGFGLSNYANGAVPIEFPGEIRAGRACDDGIVKSQDALFDVGTGE